MGRPARKKNKAEAAARKLGELEAETKFWDKQPLTKKLKRLLWKKLEALDPLETVAIIGLTPIVHNYIVDPANGLLDCVNKAISGIGTGQIWKDYSEALQQFLFEDTYLRKVYEEEKNTWQQRAREEGLVDVEIGKRYTPEEKKKLFETVKTPPTFEEYKKKYDYGTPKPKLPFDVAGLEFGHWLLSFSIAYILVEHGGEIAGMFIEGGKGLGSLVTSLLGAKA